MIHWLLIEHIALWTLGAIGVVWFARWGVEGRRLRTIPGYVVPRVSRVAAYVQGLISSLANRIVVGRVNYIKSPKIDLWNGRFVAAINHQVMMDIPVVLEVGRKRIWRYMSAVEQVKWWRSWYFAWTGCVAVIRESKEKAGLAFDAAVEGMIKDRRANFALFPQRRLVADNNLDAEGVRPGAAKIGHAVYERIGEALALLIVYVHYHETPRGLFSLPLLRKLRTVRVHMKDKNLVETTWVERKLYGATVVADDPIPLDQLPKDPAAIAQLISDRWKAMRRQCEEQERLSASK
jgi:hypothetical protein